jgi:hypothetical protein
MGIAFKEQGSGNNITEQGNGHSIKGQGRGIKMPSRANSAIFLGAGKWA